MFVCDILISVNAGGIVCTTHLKEGARTNDELGQTITPAFTCQSFIISLRTHFFIPPSIPIFLSFQ